MTRPPKFIWKPMSKDSVYEGWLGRIDNLEQLTRFLSAYDDQASDNALNLGFQLFPIIDSVAYNLFEEPGPRYLEDLGYNTRTARLIFKIFRNGQLHNTLSHRLVDEDGEVVWSMSSSASPGGWRPHVEGVDQLFTYEWDEDEEVGYAYLRLSGLAAQVRKDLEQRKSVDDRDEVPFIVGLKLRGKAPKN